MNKTVMWVQNGEFVPPPQKENGASYQDKTLIDSQSMVRIEATHLGTEVKWNMSCPNWSSLMVAAAVLAACEAPFHLRYFNAGWFSEVLSDATSAADRIEALIHKSDVRLATRAYTVVVDPQVKFLPEPLKTALAKGTAPDDNSVVCTVEADGETCQVDHVGRGSLIARIWGVSPNSYPCLNGHSYDRAVTPEYFKVVKSGRPHYDHVLASMVRPNGEQHWIGYQRVILPELSLGRKRVRVISEQAPVQIQLL